MGETASELSPTLCQRLLEVIHDGLECRGGSELKDLALFHKLDSGRFVYTIFAVDTTLESAEGGRPGYSVVLASEQRCRRARTPRCASGLRTGLAVRFAVDVRRHMGGCRVGG